LGHGAEGNAEMLKAEIGGEEGEKAQSGNHNEIHKLGGQRRGGRANALSGHLLSQLGHRPMNCLETLEPCCIVVEATASHVRHDFA